MLLPTTTSPPWPSSEMPWATNRRPPTSNEPDADRWDQVEPSRVTQMVVVATGVVDPDGVETTVPSMRRSWSTVVKYGPKSSLAKGGTVGLAQLMP